MVVKEKRGRRRYVAFEVGPGRASNEMLLAAMHSQCTRHGLKPPKVIQFDGRLGIVRCALPDMDRTIEMLNRIAFDDGTMRTLAASGTLRSLRDRFFPAVDELRN